ncbi:MULTISPECIES: hypothetical protein [Legionella]|uniref:Uncharacterized protein n=1 Tax=Legionella resiliens TaxID=2905958 RepID=A0ABS8X9B2_9GAMM|nr:MULTISPECIES: hypothetical protein [unclassified Legionella]MCE0724574.1 hypothetical protein [Legionella sp. 9fVS26]MCE3533727.1 hypothetical protein [Legionella sp. 8cVS16]QLZ69919.1 hypothetical protein FOLKNPGA_02719 [Legionella sp. PC1000]
MKILSGALFSTLVLFSVTSFANETTGSNGTGSNATPKTSMNSNWVCTTNASSSDKKADQDADKKMSEHAGSAVKSFAFATKHCRDCTQITCDVKK